MSYGRQFGRFHDAEAFEAAVRQIVEQAGPEGIRTGAIGVALGPVTYRFRPRCGHDDCTRPEHDGGSSSIHYHPADIVRPVLQRLAKRGIVGRIGHDPASAGVEDAGRVPLNQGHLWRTLAVSSRGRLSVADHVALLAASARARMAEDQADIEQLLADP